MPPQRPRDVTSTPVTPRVGGSVNTNDTLIGAPLQITPEAARPKSDPRVASAPPALLREPTETSAAPIASPGFSVQLAYRSTERDARTTFDQLQQRFASELSGFSPAIRQAEINGKTAYRVRVGPMSRDDAASLCSRLKTAGGQCFVANN
jgi:cell division protein FtsN